MKYRMLTSEERIHFDEDFKHFLIINGVSNEEWIDLNKNKTTKAVELVEIFSDKVFEKVYSKMEFLELRSKNNCIVFKMGKENIELIGLQSTGNDIDLESTEGIHSALKNNADKMTFFRKTKNYSKSREIEIHEMIEGGCFPSAAEFWDSLLELTS